LNIRSNKKGALPWDETLCIAPPIVILNRIYDIIIILSRCHPVGIKRSTMNAKLKNLKKALVESGLLHHSIPYIHGALTARAVMPFIDDFEVDEAMALAILFDENEQNTPAKGYDTATLHQMLDLAETVEFEIESSVMDSSFKPFFGEGTRQTKDIASEWCKGFLSVTLYVMKKPDNEDMTDKETFALTVLLTLALGKSGNISDELSLLLKKNFIDMEKLISDCVYEIDSFWRKWEEVHDKDGKDDDPDDLYDQPVIREKSKIGRNDPCPCGSGKKYKKCCGKNGALIDTELTATVIDKKSEGEALLHESPSNSSRKSGGKQCFICGKTKNLVKTPCCGQWICDDDDQYVLFSYSRNSCMRNHRRYTLCGQHFDARHEGDWKSCGKCRKESGHELEMYVWYGTNEYNHEKLPDPPAFKPTLCAKCKRRIVLPDGGFTIKAEKYYCDRCEKIMSF
jgi:uncharacterized protein YecA (UPF0149 family)